MKKKKKNLLNSPVLLSPWVVEEATPFPEVGPCPALPLAGWEGLSDGLCSCL